MTAEDKKLERPRAGRMLASPEAVDARTGVVVEQGNVDMLAEVIRRMKAQPLFSVDCRKRAEECFDKDKCFMEYVRLYEKLML